MGSFTQAMDASQPARTLGENGAPELTAHGVGDARVALDDDVGLAERAHLDVLAVDAALPAVELLEPGRCLVDQRVRARRGHGGLGGWFLRWRCGRPRIVSCCVRRRAAASDDVEEDFVALAGHGLAVVILRSLQLQHAAVKGRCAE